MQCFEIDEKDGVIKLAEGIFEQIDEKYREASIVSFSYGASDAANVK